MRGREAYWLVRRLSEESTEFKKESARFECTAWASGNGVATRHADGHVLRAYYIEGEPEATIIYPDGHSRSFA